MPEKHIANIGRNFRGVIAVDLREGEQFAGKLKRRDGETFFDPFEFTLRQAQYVLKSLYRLGVEYAEVPNGVVPGMQTYVPELTRMKHRPKLLAHIRTNIQDVHQAKDEGVEGVDILGNVEPERLKALHIDTFSDYLNLVGQVIQTAQSLGLETRMSVEKFWDSNFESGLAVLRLAESLGVDRIGLADTLGKATHWEVADKVKNVRRYIKKAAIEAHVHSDGAESIANALEALANGANWIDTTILGVGERRGIPDLAELLYRLYLMDPNFIKNYHLELLRPIYKKIARMYGIAIPHDSPVSDNAFAHKGGIHLRALMREGPQAYEPSRPAVVGNRRYLIRGARISGRATEEEIAEFYAKYGFD